MAKNSIRKRWLPILLALMLIISLMVIPAQAASIKSVDHIDIGVSLTANVKIDGVLYEDLHYTLQKSDITGSNLTITSNGPAFTYNTNNIGTSTGSSGINQYRVSGNFPVTDASGNKVTYTVELKKTITVETNSNEKVDIPVKFVGTFGYWDSDNDCPGIARSKSSWKNGSVISGSGMDFLLGNADSDTNTKGTITIQKTLTGLEIEEGEVMDFTFDIYKANGTPVTSATAHVESGSPYAAVSVSELPFGSYYVTERAADVEGYTYTTSYHIESNGETTGKTETFALNANNPVSHAYVTNTYTAIPQPTDIDISVEKVWQNDTPSLRPEAVLVQLYRDGTAYGEPVELSEANEWIYIWEELDDSYTWTVDELNVPNGYFKEVSHDGNYFLIFNIHEDPRVGDAYISVTKQWDDNGYPDRPAAVTVQLTLDGEPAGEPVVLNADNGWSYKWYNVNPDMGWTVTEVDVAEGYTSTVVQDGLYFTITNSMDYTPPATEPPVTEPPVTEPPATEPVPAADDGGGEPAYDPDAQADDGMADVPYTGTATGIWVAMSILSGAGLTGLAFTRRKKENDN